MLRLHQEKPDYLVVLDYHDDVVVFDSSQEPEAVEFYQVKTKKPGYWSLDNLLERAKGSALSIVGKMYAHRLAFGHEVRQMQFISNALYSLEKASAKGSKTQKVEAFTAKDLCQEALHRLSASLQEEHKLEYCPIADLRLSFATTPLSVTEHVTHAKGRFTEFLEQKCGLIHISTSHAFKCLIEELRKRCNCEDGITSISELAQKKGMTKKEFEQRINTISQAALPEKWRRFEAILIQEGVDIIRLGRFQKAWETHQVQRLDTTNGILQEASILVAKAFDSLHAEMQISPLMPFLAALQARCMPILQSKSIPFNDETIAAITFTHLDGLANES